MGEMKVGLEKEEAMIHKQEEEVAKEQAKIKEALHDREKQLKSLEKKEKAITPGLDEEILFKFERIIRSKLGLGIVPIDHGVCNGCHMILTVQFVNEVRQGRGHHVLPLLQPHPVLPGRIRRGAGDGGGRGGGPGGGGGRRG